MLQRGSFNGPLFWRLTLLERKETQLLDNYRNSKTQTVGVVPMRFRSNSKRVLTPNSRIAIICSFLWLLTFSYKIKTLLLTPHMCKSPRKNFCCCPALKSFFTETYLFHLALPQRSKAFVFNRPHFKAADFWRQFLQLVDRRWNPVRQSFYLPR